MTDYYDFADIDDFDEEESDSEHRTLATWGWLDQSQTLNFLQGYHCAWADLDGWHNGEPIAGELPVTTHIWAWSRTGNSMLRIRVDQDRALIVGLFPETEAFGNNPQPQAIEEVLTQRVELILWGTEERRFSATTRKHFETDWEAETIQNRPGLAFYRHATSLHFSDGAVSV